MKEGSKRVSDSEILEMLALKIEEAAMSQGMHAPLESGKCKEMDFSLEPLEKNIALHTSDFTHKYLFWKFELQNCKRIFLLFKVLSLS